MVAFMMYTRSSTQRNLSTARIHFSVSGDIIEGNRALAVSSLMEIVLPGTSK